MKESSDMEKFIAIFILFLIISLINVLYDFYYFFHLLLIMIIAILLMAMVKKLGKILFILGAFSLIFAILSFDNMLDFGYYILLFTLFMISGLYYEKKCLDCFEIIKNENGDGLCNVCRDRRE